MYKQVETTYTYTGSGHTIIQLTGFQLTLLVMTQ